jgi:hypothetical protein
LIAGPASRRSSGLIEPRVLSRPEIEPDLPRAATRIASMAAASAAAAMLAESSASRVVRSVMWAVV